MSQSSRRAFLASVGGVTLLGLGGREIETPESSTGVAGTLEAQISGNAKPNPELDATDIDITGLSTKPKIYADDVGITTTAQFTNTGDRGYEVEIAVHPETKEGHKLNKKRLLEESVGANDVGGASHRFMISRDIYPSFSNIVIDWIRVRSRRDLLESYSDTYYPNNAN